MKKLMLLLALCLLLCGCTREEPAPEPERPNPVPPSPSPVLTEEQLLRRAALGAELAWGDLSDCQFTVPYEGYEIYHIPVGTDYYLKWEGPRSGKPESLELIDADETDRRVDVRFGDVAGFLAGWPDRDWGVSLEAKDANSSTLTLVLRRQGGSLGGEVTYRSAFWLERWEEGGWLRLEEQHQDSTWTSNNWQLKLDSSRDELHRLSAVYGQLTPGKYRLGKELRYQGEYDRDIRVCYAEFEVPVLRQMTLADLLALLDRGNVTRGDLAPYAYTELVPGMTDHYRLPEGYDLQIGGPDSGELTAMTLQPVPGSGHSGWVDLLHGDVEGFLNGYKDYDLGLTLTATEVTSTGAAVTMAQSGGRVDHALTYGVDYFLQVWQDGAWVQPPIVAAHDISWVSIGISLEPGQTVTERYNWSWYYGELPPGRYRFCKSFLYSTDYERINRTAYAGFEIQ